MLVTIALPRQTGHFMEKFNDDRNLNINIMDISSEIGSIDDGTPGLAEFKSRLFEHIFISSDNWSVMIDPENQFEPIREQRMKDIINNRQLREKVNAETNEIDRLINGAVRAEDKIEGGESIDFEAVEEHQANKDEAAVGDGIEEVEALVDNDGDAVDA